MAYKNHNFIQWNIRGLRANREELELLINKYSPAAICLQEVMLKEDNLQTFKNYTHYYCCTDSGRGGSGLLVKNNYFHSEIKLKTSLQAVAVHITIKQKKYSLCSIYVPPTDHLNISKQDLNNLKSQLPTSCIFMGDFNGHSEFWGALNPNDRGNVIEDFIIEEDLLLFNNKIHTYTHNGYSSLFGFDDMSPISVFRF